MTADITQRDLVETILGLRSLASDLKEASNGEPVAGIAPSAVPVGVTALLDASKYLTTVAEELVGLVPDCPPPIPPKD